ENSVIAIIIGIIIIIAGSTLFGKSASGGTDSKTPDTYSADEVSGSVASSDKNDTEIEMETILSLIKGAGSVNVMITYESGNEKVPAYDTKKNENTTQEKDNSGGTRNSAQNSYDSSIVYEDIQGGNKKPVIIKEIPPKVMGVLVVADGANNPQVREELTNSVKVLVDVPAYKIQITERGRGLK
ncbi:MAG TPA: stage III sporulation protein AG, partial [Clostridia bacterium]|nr:stage III sporulation protein AG [Clostridia bacterium]